MTTDNIGDSDAAVNPHAEHPLTVAALNWAAAGVEVTQRAAGKKHPRLDGWKDDPRRNCTTSAAVVVRFAESQPDSGFFGPMGKTAGQGIIFALDFDSGKDNYDVGDFPVADLPPTATQFTPSGGKHMFYRMPDGTAKIKTGQNVFGTTGVDIRGTGGGVAIYQPVEWHLLADAPDWLARMVVEDTSAEIAVESREANGEEMVYTYDDEAHANLRHLLGGIDPDRSEEDWYIIINAANRISNGDPRAFGLVESWCQQSSATSHSPLKPGDLAKRWAKPSTKHGWTTLVEASANGADVYLSKPETASTALQTIATEVPDDEPRDGEEPEPADPVIAAKRRRKRVGGHMEPAPVRGIPWHDDWRMQPELPLCSLRSDNADTVRMALGMLGISLSHNPRLDVNYLVYNGERYPLGDRQEEYLRDILARQFDLRTKKGPVAFEIPLTTWKSRVMCLTGDYEVNAYKEFLASVPDWDGQARLDGWMGTLFNSEGDPLVEWASRYAFLAVVQRQAEPGCKLDEIPVLVGQQGAGKSVAVANIFPPESHQLFSDDFTLGGDAQKNFEKTNGFALCEIGEMAGLDKGSVENIKQFVSATQDVLRRSYRRNAEVFPRTTVFIGTSNSKSFIPPSEGGNRRFVPVTLKGQDGGTDKGLAIEAPEEWLDEHRMQLWAEARHMYASGVRANLTRELRPALADASHEHTHRDTVMDELIQTRLLLEGKGVSGEFGVGRFTKEEVVTMLGLADSEKRDAAKVSKSQYEEVRKSLQEAGFVWHQVRSGVGRGRRLWEHTEYAEVEANNERANAEINVVKFDRTGKLSDMADADADRRNAASLGVRV